MKTLAVMVATLFLASGLSGQGWVRQNPNAQFARLNDVDFDGAHGLTVGNDGVLFTTDDAGNTWVPRRTPDADENLKTAFVMPGTNGQTMLAGGDSLLLLSINGGDTWTITYDDIQGIYKIQVAPTGEWMVLGATYSARSADQGGFWQPMVNPGLDATAGHYISIEEGWMSSGDPNNVQVWVTTNGGFSWELRDPHKFHSITDLVMVNNLVGYLVSGSEVYKTINGGIDWISQNAVPSGNITDMHVITQSEVWTSLDNGNTYYSLSGGNGWIERLPDLLTNNSAQGIYANLDGHVYMPGKYVSMLYSDDFGLTWRDQIPGTKVTLFQPHFFNEFIGIVAGADGTLMATINGGDNWGVIQFPKDDHFFAAAMIDNHSMVIGSSRGRVYYSENLGTDWDTIGTGLGQITDIEAFNNQTFIISTEAGRIYKTTDQGNQWNIEYDNGGNPLFALDFPTTTKGWAAGFQGEIVATTNGGDSWNPQPNPGKARFSDITFTNDQEGWAVSTSFTDSLWFTKDGGLNWFTTLLPYKSFWNGVSFTNPDTGWIAGGVSGVGDVLRTNDRGQTWTQNHTSPELFNGIYAVPEIETVWAVGYGGNIMKYTPCHTLPQLDGLTGEGSPCKGDTVSYAVTPSEVDHFLWFFPAGWEVISNPDSSFITVVAGENGGDIRVFGTNVCGNISSAQVITATPIDIPQVTIGESKGNVLFTNVTSLEYQWLLNGVPIPGATNPFYTAVENGVYQLLVTVPGTGCAGISNELQVTIVATAFAPQDKYEIFPVPATDILYVSERSGKNELEGKQVSFYTVEGSTVMTSKLASGKLDVSSLSPGIYMMMIRFEQEVWVAKVLVE